MYDTSTEAVKALLEGLAPGPWRVSLVDDTCVEDATGNCVAEIDGDYNQPETWPWMEANARFIAAARDLVPALAAELATARDERDAALTEAAALRKEVERLRGALGETLDAIEGYNRTLPDEDGLYWDRSDLITQEIMSGRAALAALKGAANE